MSDPDSLPPELASLEHELSSRPRHAPSPELRTRVLGDVSRQVARQSKASFWGYMSLTAAAALVWINLAWSASLATDFGFLRDNRGPTVTSVAGQIERLLPDLSEREATACAITLKTGAPLARGPRLPDRSW